MIVTAWHRHHLAVFAYQKSFLEASRRFFIKCLRCGCVSALSGQSLNDHFKTLLAPNNLQLLADLDRLARFQPYAVHPYAAKLNIVLRQRACLVKTRGPKPFVQANVTVFNPEFPKF